ncbi:hypothetical protein KCH_05950 [Kitasatospora cheerisanensis KCTC 2395]|uniref:Uncharacterized protein n=1 Tax=Kitasatospora cheerisanensis KCTC 2395 TaxID=1348663 RepID=A0A066Z634_9ACTN|nr:hypothetical protein KCH_05950 [Kitasatospora cheerisanensis KCTC 2395]
MTGTDTAGRRHRRRPVGRVRTAAIRTESRPGAGSSSRGHGPRVSVTLS